MGQVIGAILALGFLIMVHEAGHLIVARWCGMRVERFSIGFGPGILRWRSKKGTLYQLAPIPFGGFVEIRGMNLAEEVDPDDKSAYPNRPVWQRMATIFAGPFTNVLAAVALAYVLYACHGYDRDINYFEVSQVSLGPRGIEQELASRGVTDERLVTFIKERYADREDSPASGVLRAGDRILAVDGKPVYITGPRGETDSLRDKFGARPAELTIEREVCEGDVCRYELQPPIVIQPRESACGSSTCYRIGVGLTNHRVSLGTEPVGPLQAVREAVVYPIRQSEVILGGLWQVVTRDAELEAAGPAGITVVIKQAIEAGWVTTFLLLMMLNVYLGLFNLFPLPPLDGARLAFLGYELVTRRRANPKVEATVFMIGVLILIPVLIMVTVGDCRRMF